MNAEIQPSERRTSGIQRHGRAAKVVASVLRATGEELNKVGYANLRVESVAERAGVSKTTIYRRWPTKALLVSETLESQFQSEREMPDTGSLREDLVAYLANMVKLASEPMWRGVLTTLLERSDPEVEAVARKLYNRERRFRVGLIERAIERGELPRSVNAELVAEVFSAPILRRLLTFGEIVEPGYVEGVVDIALAGAAATAMREIGTG